MSLPASSLRFLLIAGVLCLSAFFTIAQTEKEYDGIEEKVERLLQKRDLGDLANDLARQTTPKTTESLLIKLSVFARAGHRARVLEILTSVPKAADYKTSPYSSHVFRVAQKAIGLNDFQARKAFYELIAPSGDENVSSLIPLWQMQGDASEVEKWLKPRAAANETWWREWLAFRQRLGTEQEIYDEMTAAIRKDPSNFDLVRKYLLAVVNNGPTSVPPTSLSYVRDVAWLADTVKTDLAYEAYELADLLKGHSPAASAKLFEKSLTLPFAEKDRELFGLRTFRGASMRPAAVNPEKQLRYWTKKSLVELYQQSAQPHLAQPMAEQLVGMDTSDIQAGDSYHLAGMVQANSGHRVIEAKILRDEAANIDSAQYWIDRAQYYNGRDEHAQTWQTLMTALEKFPYKPNDYQHKPANHYASSPRLRVLIYLRAFGYSYEEREKDAEEILRHEIRKAASERDGRFIFELTQWMENDFEDLFDEVFINTDMLPTILSSFESWRDQHEGLITEVMENDKWDTTKRNIVWHRLTELSRNNVKTRAYSLSVAMDNDNRDKIPLLLECLKIAPLVYVSGMNFNREDVDKELSDAYIATADWRNAEKMYGRGYHYWGNELGKIAVAAVTKAPMEALRVWKMNANLDRRNLDGLEQLSKTDAKPLLVKFYLDMKKRDNLTDAPDKALQLLK